MTTVGIIVGPPRLVSNPINLPEPRSFCKSLKLKLTRFKSLRFTPVILGTSHHYIF